MALGYGTSALAARVIGRGNFFDERFEVVHTIGRLGLKPGIGIPSRGPQIRPTAKC